MQDNVKGALAMMASMALFTFNDAAMRMLAGDVPFFQAIFLRGLGTCILLPLLAYALGALRFDMSGRDWGLTLLRTLSEVVAAYLFITALWNAPIANVTAILQALPLTVSLGGAVFLGEPIGWRRMLAILVGFVGVLFIVQPGAEGFNIYSVYALGAVVAVTIRDLSSRRLSKSVPSLTVAVVGALGITLFSGLGTLSENWVMPSASAWGLLLFAILTIMCAYVFSVITMRVGEIGAVTPFRYTGLLWAILLGVVLFDEVPDHMTLIGSAIVVATGLFTLLRERQLGRRATPLGGRLR